MEVYPGVMEAHPGAVEAPRNIRLYPGTEEVYLVPWMEPTFEPVRLILRHKDFTESHGMVL